MDEMKVPFIYGTHVLRFPMHTIRTAGLYLRVSDESAWAALGAAAGL